MNPHSPEEPKSSGKSILQRFSRVLDWWQTHSIRDVWWAFLDAWEKSRALRFSSYAMLATLLITAGVVWVAYPYWAKHNAARITRQWLDANKLQHATITAQQVIDQAPDSAASWQLAAEVARRRNDKQRALYTSGMAARLAPENTRLVLLWASDALLSDRSEIAQKALQLLTENDLESSAWGQRIAGEIARRARDLSTARIHFEHAITIEGPLAVNQVPLGTILLNAADPDEREQGRKLLRRWTEDTDWGAPAMRILLEDALKQRDLPMMAEWAEKLRAHPQCTLNDIANCLRALSESNESRFREVIAQMMANHSDTATDAAQLVGWLNRIGRSREADGWVETLPPALTDTMPLPPIIAETLRLEARWDALQTWTNTGDWGANLDPLRTAYHLLATKNTQQSILAGDSWQTLLRLANNNGGRALFVADIMYAWGLQKEAVELLWIASQQSGHSLQALGTLARHYQVNRDAEGQYRVFEQLHNLRVNDPNIANNYAFFATLTGNSLRRAEHIAKDNFHRDPQNETFRATFAYTLIHRGRYPQARTIIQSIRHKWPEVPAIAFIHGLLLVHDGDKTAAREAFYSINPADLTLMEISMIQSLLE